MNRFRSRKKSLGDKTHDVSRRPSLESDVPALPSFSSRTFKRKKQVAPEPKPEIDLTSALPGSDDFRTSLLMPNLSARFSMLREQDDPTSKLGKANDDSVLFPKRASRLDLFNRQGLSDIAEVDSVRGSIRPPFAQSRTESYGSAGYDTDEGSMISRARPGEGNTMFGGRQKIYKIPVNGSGSVKNFGSPDEGELPVGGNMGGKALYESDIAMSAFQRLREEEKQQERERTDTYSMRSSRENDRSGSPPLPKYNRNRETTSSTNSGPSQPRTSTAATSVASQKSVYGAHEAINGGSHTAQPNTQPSTASSERPIGKSRRLYGQGLDQHMYEQQSSALHRLESLHRSRTPVGGPSAKSLPHSRSATNLNDRYQRGGPLYASNGFRAGSPPPSGTPPRMRDFDLSLATEDSPNDSNAEPGHARSPVLGRSMSPPHDLIPQDPTLVAALEPNDLGKATASGAFNKPWKQYNEQQYLQRQLALHEGQGTPSPHLNRPFSPYAFPTNEQSTSRSRNNSLGSNFSRTNSLRQPWEHHIEDRILKAVPESASSPSGHIHADRNEQSFLTGMSGSEMGSESEAELSSPMASTPQFEGFSDVNSTPKVITSKESWNAPLGPKHLQFSSKQSTSDSQSHRSGTTITQQRSDHTQELNNVNDLEVNPPTLGPVEASNGLNGLVHQHLRNDSSTSSIYPDESPDKLPIESRDSIFGHASALNHSRQHPRDNAQANVDIWASKRPTSDQSNVKAPPPLSFAARHILEQATALKNNQNKSIFQQSLRDDKAQRILGGEAPRSSHSRSPSVTWQEQLRAHHARVGSTETQQEREELANEMAERRRMVQDNLKNYAEVDDRSAPPTRTRDDSPAKLTPPFGILKKSSRGSLVGKQERPAKALKMLGIGSGTGLASTSGPDSARFPPEVYVGRDQLSDRAMPPKQSFPPQPIKRPQVVRQNSANSQTIQHCEQGIHQNHETTRASPRSSKSGSSYSDRSDRRSPGSRKNSNVTTASMERGRVNAYKSNAAGHASEGKHPNLSAPRPTDELIASMARHGPPPTERSHSDISGRTRSGSTSTTSAMAYSEPRVAPPGTPYMINPSPSRSGPNPFAFAASTNDSRPSISSAPSSASTMVLPQRLPTHAHNRPSNYRKHSINKCDISEPTFISCTSSVDTVNLPEGASLSNGMDSPPLQGSAPPIPVRDSRRKRTQTLLQALGRAEKPERSLAPYSPSPRSADPYEEQSTFSADDEPPQKSVRQRLRKTSSEGGSMAQKARQQAFNTPSSAVPNFEVQSSSTGHIPYQAQKDVPASAVMF